jgi:hypothetical protein
MQRFYVPDPRSIPQIQTVNSIIFASMRDYA